VSRSFAKASLSGAAQFVVATVLVMVTIPLLVTMRGVEAYGVFSLVLVVGNLNTFAGLGLNLGLVRFLASQGKTPESNLDIVVALLLQTGIILPLSGIAFLFRQEILLGVLNVPVARLGDAEPLLIAVLAGNTFLLVGQIFTAVLDAQQKVHLANVCQMIYNVLYWGGILITLPFSDSIADLALPVFVSALGWFVLVFIVSVRTWGGYSWQGIADGGMRAARRQLRYGVQIYAGGVINVLFEPLIKVLLSHVGGVSEVAVLDISLRIKELVYRFIAKILYPLFPLLSTMTDPDRIRLLLHKTAQKSLFFMVPLAAMGFVVARPLMDLFLPEHAEQLATATAATLGGYLIGSVPVFLIYQYLIIKGEPAKTILIQAVNAVVGSTVLLLTVRWLGFYASVAGITVAILASGLVLLFFQRKYSGRWILDSWRQFIQLASLGALVGLSGIAVRLVMPAGIPSIIGPSGVMALFTVICFRWAGVITREDLVELLGGENKIARAACVVFDKRYRLGTPLTE
jgi:O-antigen/teichoic acid export membrane protein